MKVEMRAEMVMHVGRSLCPVALNGEVSIVVCFHRYMRCRFGCFALIRLQLPFIMISTTSRTGDGWT